MFEPQEPTEANPVGLGVTPRKPRDVWDDVTVAGVTFGKRQQAIAKVKQGDTLYLFADPFGKVMGQITGDAAASTHNDPNAVMVCRFDQALQQYEPVGYLPRQVAPVFSQALANVPAYQTFQAIVRAVVGGPEKGYETYGLRIDLPAI